MNDKVEHILFDQSFIVFHQSDGSIVHYKNNGFICDDQEEEIEEEEEEEEIEEKIVKEKKNFESKFFIDHRIQDPLPKILKRSYWRDLKENVIGFSDFSKKLYKEEKKKKEKKGLDQYQQGDHKRKRKFEIMKLNQNEYDIHRIENH